MEAAFAKFNSVTHDNSTGTDKGTTHSYLEVYEEHFGPLRDAPVRMLEIGVYSGASLCAWNEYFTNNSKEIHGIDICPDRLSFEVNNYHVLDGTDPQTADILGGTWDIVIDDGSHEVEDQLKTLSIFGRLMNPDGIYVIEDIVDLSIANSLKIMGRELGLSGQVYDRQHVKGRTDDIILFLQK
jgi:SAM-dependent methyltransferase